MLQVTTSDDPLMASRNSDLGLDSLISVDIRSWFLKSLGVGVPVLQIMGNNTMSNVVQYAVENMPEDITPCIERALVDNSNTPDSAGNFTITKSGLTGDTSIQATSGSIMPSTSKWSREPHITGKIDWIAESTPPTDLADIPRVQGSNPVNPPRVIILTGAGGLLGHHLVGHLLENLPQVKIHCIAVRNLATRLQRHELPTAPRVTYHEGDLSAPLLGLSAEDAAHIFGEADVVVHNGADTSHLKYYTDLKATNVGSTVALVRLCLPRRVPIHYVSSAGVAMLYHEASFPEVPVTGPRSSLPAGDGSFGYGCSKWASERLLEQVHDLYGLRICIHRPSTIIREEEDARGTRAEMDWVNALFHYAGRIRAVPMVEHNRGVLDLVRVRSCCEDITRHIVDDSERARREVVYVHEVGDVVVPLQQLRDIGLNKPDGAAYEVLPMGVWIAKAVTAGLHPAVASLIETVDTPGSPHYPRLLKDRAHQKETKPLREAGG